MADRTRYDATKRALDASVAAVGLVATAPLQAVVALAVLTKHGRPVLFRQPRPGKDGRVFELVKFRTMLLPDTQRVADADRLTSLGKRGIGASDHEFEVQPGRRGTRHAVECVADEVSDA